MHLHLQALLECIICMSVAVSLFGKFYLEIQTFNLNLNEKETTIESNPVFG